MKYRTIVVKPRQIAALNHARSHDLSKRIDECWRCRLILWRERRRQREEPA